MFLIGATTGEEAFFSAETGIDWNVILLLFGMMVVISVVKQTGLFEYLAIWAGKRAKGRPYRLLVLLCLITAVRPRCWTTSPRCCCRPGHPAGVRPARGPPRTVSRRHRHGQQHRWGRHPDR